MREIGIPCSELGGSWERSDLVFRNMRLTCLTHQYGNWRVSQRRSDFTAFLLDETNRFGSLMVHDSVSLDTAGRWVHPDKATRRMGSGNLSPLSRD